MLAHNREAIEAHPVFRRIDTIEGSSIAPDIRFIACQAESDRL
jgi:hypothetical protein